MTVTTLIPPAAKPVQGWTHVTTRAGLILHIRPVKDDDEALISDFFAHVTPDELRFRFLSSVRVPGHACLVAMTRIDHDRTENFLAFDDAGNMVASGMLAADQALERAEVAISVRAESKHKGVAWTLLEHVTAYARSRGIRVIESIEARENRAAIELEQEMGFVAHSVEGDPRLVRVSLSLLDEAA